MCRSVVSNSLQPHGLYSPGNSLGQNTGVGSLSLLLGIFPIQGSNPGLLHCRRILYQLNHKVSPRVLGWVAIPSPGDLLDPGIEPRSPTLQVDSLPTEISRKSQCQITQWQGPRSCLLCLLHWQEGSSPLVPTGKPKEIDTERLINLSRVSHTREGSGTPLQYSCLENPRDGGAWWAAIYRVAQSRTRLNQLSSSQLSQLE